MNKINLVVPLAGKAQRFLDKGFKMPKPLIFAKEKMIIDRTMECIEWKNCNLIFIVRAEHVSNFQIDEVLRKKFGKDVKIVVANHDTQGSVCSVMLAMEHINNDAPLVVHCSDVYFELDLGQKFDPYTVTIANMDGALLTFKSNSPNYSYCEIEQDGMTVKRVVEKQVISNHANAGIYCFQRGSDFVKYARQMMELNDTTNGEFFIAPLYNHLIKDGLKVIAESVDKMYIFGTPNELKFYNECIMNNFGDGVIGLAADHSGFELKEECKKIFDIYRIPYIDYGTYSSNASDYVTYSGLVVKAIEDKICTHGITFCSTGQGQNMYMNKFNFVRNALVWNAEMAEMSVRHNAANCWSIPAKFVDGKTFQEIVMALRDNTFDGGRHQTRVMKLMGLV